MVVVVVVVIVVLLCFVPSVFDGNPATNEAPPAACGPHKKKEGLKEGTQSSNKNRKVRKRILIIFLLACTHSCYIDPIRKGKFIGIWLDWHREHDAGNTSIILRRRIEESKKKHLSDAGVCFVAVEGRGTGIRRLDCIHKQWILPFILNWIAALLWRFGEGTLGENGVKCCFIHFLK